MSSKSLGNITFYCEERNNASLDYCLFSVSNKLTPTLINNLIRNSAIVKVLRKKSGAEIVYSLFSILSIEKCLIFRRA